MFAKYWQAGRVKTRLAKRLGSEAAAELYRAFVAALLTRLKTVADRRVLAFTPPDRRVDFARFAGERWQLEPQGAGDLGSRIERYLAAALNRGAQRVVLIGSDSPLLPIARIEQAFRLLADCDVVLGPSDDGGYYLVGVSGSVPRIFDGIAWSTPHVWPQTLAHIERLRLRFSAMPSYYDVDDLQDLIRLREELDNELRDRMNDDERDVSFSATDDLDALTALRTAVRNCWLRLG